MYSFVSVNMHLLSATTYMNCMVHVNLINVAYLTYQIIMTLHFLNDVLNDVESS